MTPSRPTAAVVGSGVAGLTAAFLLQRTHDVTLFEADDRLGGHAHTHELTTSDGSTAFVDSGFIVHNARTYPNLLRIFAELGVAVKDFTDYAKAKPRPGTVELMTQNLIGQIALVVGFGLFATGFLVIQRMTRVEQ